MSGQVTRAVLLGLADAAAAFVALMLIVWLAVLLLHALLAPGPLAGDVCPPPDHAVMTPTGPGCAESVTFGVKSR